jgi:hypothetical protein
MKVASSLVQIASLSLTGAIARSKVILFMVPGDEFISGGLLSIFNLYRFSEELATVHNARVLMCFYPGEGEEKWHYKKMDHEIMVYSFKLVLATCRRVKAMQLHVPEYAVQTVVKEIGWKRLTQLRLTHGLRINILSQNIELMPPDNCIARLREVLPEITCTTAHPSYSTAEYRRRLGIPVHHLPAWTYPEEVKISGYETKRELLIVSPDPSPHRESILRLISSELPHLQIQVISGIPFKEYLKLAQVAKWSLTFGEGLDDYFIGLFFRGGVGFAVYNDEFFTKEFKRLRTVYADWKTLAGAIVGEIKDLDSKQAMESYSAEVRGLLTQIWSRDKTKAALEKYYQGKFTLP